MISNGALVCFTCTWYRIYANHPCFITWNITAHFIATCKQKSSNHGHHQLVFFLGTLYKWPGNQYRQPDNKQQCIKFTPWKAGGEKKKSLTVNYARVSMCFAARSAAGRLLCECQSRSTWEQCDELVMHARQQIDPPLRSSVTESRCCMQWCMHVEQGNRNKHRLHGTTLKWFLIQMQRTTNNASHSWKDVKTYW